MDHHCRDRAHAVCALLAAPRAAYVFERLGRPAAPSPLATSLARLLVVKAAAGDGAAGTPPRYSPTPSEDELWHALLLDTDLYATVCAAARGVVDPDAAGRVPWADLVVRHDPRGQDDPPDARGVRRAAAAAARAAIWPEDVPVP